AALGFFGDLTAKLLCRRRRIFTPRRGFYLFRLRPKHPRSLGSRCGHHGLLTTTRHARESHGRSNGFPVLHGFAPTTISIDRTVRSRYHDNSPNLPDGALQYIPKIEFLAEKLNQWLQVTAPPFIWSATRIVRNVVRSSTAPVRYLWTSALTAPAWARSPAPPACPRARSTSISPTRAGCSRPLSRKRRSKRARSRSS